jgi:uncharacterized protein
VKPSELLRSHRNAVLAIATRNGAQNVRVFGSVVRGEDIAGSDIDLLVDVPRGTTLLDMVRMQSAIEQELGVSVDILTAEDLPQKIRQRVLDEAKNL